MHPFNIWIQQMASFDNMKQNGPTYLSSTKRPKIHSNNDFTPFKKQHP